MLRHEIDITKYPVYINNHKDTPYRASVSRESRIYIQILADYSLQCIIQVGILVFTTIYRVIHLSFYTMYALTLVIFDVLTFLETFLYII